MALLFVTNNRLTQHDVLRSIRAPICCLYYTVPYIIFISVVSFVIICTNASSNLRSYVEDKTSDVKISFKISELRVERPTDSFEAILTVYFASPNLG